MSTITREWLQQKIADMEATRDEIPFGLDEGDSNTLSVLIMALASLEAEAVHQVLIGDAWVDLSKGAMESQKRVGAIARTVYTAPPAPVSVPDDYFSSLVAAARVRAEKAMRKFPQPNYVLNKVAEESGEVIKAVIHFTEGREEWQNVEGEIIDNLAMLIRLVMEGDQVIGFTPPDACRAAMLQSFGNSEQLEHDRKPELAVWYGAMPETNGKTNWTAILHRKGQHAWEGITIERSEYPDRVRYEADRMSHLIGELDNEPDILAYDADAHSGYVNPGNSPVIPDGWVMVPVEPTLDMVKAGAVAASTGMLIPGVYKDMLAAAPQQEVK